MRVFKGMRCITQLGLGGHIKYNLVWLAWLVPEITLACDLTDLTQRIKAEKGSLEDVYYELQPCEKKGKLDGRLYWMLSSLNYGREEQVKKYKDLNLPLNLDYVCESAIRGYRLAVMEVADTIAAPLLQFPVEEHYEVASCLDNILLMTDKTYVDTKMVKECLELGFRSKNLNSCF